MTRADRIYLAAVTALFSMSAVCFAWAWQLHRSARG